MPKKSLARCKVSGLLEPGHVVLPATAGKKHPRIMTMPWHTMLDFEPPQIACVVCDHNYSCRLLISTKECVISIPTLETAE